MEVVVCPVSGSAFGEIEGVSQNFACRVYSASDGCDACLLFGGWNSRAEGTELETLFGDLTHHDHWRYSFY